MIIYNSQLYQIEKAISDIESYLIDEFVSDGFKTRH